MNNSHRKFIIIVFSIIIFICLGAIVFSEAKDLNTPCVDWSSGRSAPGIYTRELGQVKIQNEDCKIIETYLVPACYKENGSHYRCKGEITICGNNSILTRLTVCPSFTHENQVNQVRSGKTSHEEVK